MNAQEVNTAQAENPVGLYKAVDETGKVMYLGVTDPAAGDAVVRQGFRLVKEGIDAAKMSDKAIAAALAKNEAPEAQEVKEAE